MSTFKIYGLFAFISLIGICVGQQTNFSNPIDDLLYADPAAIFHLDDHYYVTVNHMVTSEVLIYKSRFLSNFRHAEYTKFYPFEILPNVTTPVIWGPKLHVVDEQLYLYVAYQGHDGIYRQYGLRARNSSDPMGEWEAPVEVLSNWNIDAIDGTIFYHGGKNYLVWNDGHSIDTKIFIAEMTSALTTIRPYTVIKSPSQRWECEGRCTTEDPAFFYGRDRSVMAFTTSSEYHRLSYSSVANDKDPMDPNSWDHFGVVFDTDVEERVLGPGHASFTDSPDGTEIWMLYAATFQLGMPFYNSIEKISWNPDGSPSFPRAHGSYKSQPLPSGERYN